MASFRKNATPTLDLGPWTLDFGLSLMPLTLAPPPTPRIGVAQINGPAPALRSAPAKEGRNPRNHGCTRIQPEHPDATSSRSSPSPPRSGRGLERGVDFPLLPPHPAGQEELTRITPIITNSKFPFAPIRVIRVSLPSHSAPNAKRAGPPTVAPRRRRASSAPNLADSP